MSTDDYEDISDRLREDRDDDADEDDEIAARADGGTVTPDSPSVPADADENDETSALWSAIDDLRGENERQNERITELKAENERLRNQVDRYEHVDRALATAAGEIDAELAPEAPENIRRGIALAKRIDRIDDELGFNDGSGTADRSERARELQRDLLARADERTDSDRAYITTSDAESVVDGWPKTRLRAMREASEDSGFKFDQRTDDHGGRGKVLKINAEAVDSDLLEALRGGME
jgi:hypothetical protein